MSEKEMTAEEKVRAVWPEAFRLYEFEGANVWQTEADQKAYAEKEEDLLPEEAKGFLGRDWEDALINFLQSTPKPSALPDAGGEFTEEEREQAGRQVGVLSDYPFRTPATFRDIAIATQCALNRANAKLSAAPELVYAKNLAVLLAKKHYPEVTHWKLGEDLMTVLTQIDNTVSQLVRAEPAAPQRVPEDVAASAMEFLSGFQSPDRGRQMAEFILSLAQPQPPLPAEERAQRIADFEEGHCVTAGGGLPKGIEDNPLEPAWTQLNNAMSVINVHRTLNGLNALYVAEVLGHTQPPLPAQGGDGFEAWYLTRRGPCPRGKGETKWRLKKLDDREVWNAALSQPQPVSKPDEIQLSSCGNVPLTPKQTVERVAAEDWLKEQSSEGISDGLLSRFRGMAVAAFLAGSLWKDFFIESKPDEVGRELLRVGKEAYEVMAGSNTPFDAERWSRAVIALGAAITRAESAWGGK